MQRGISRTRTRDEDEDDKFMKIYLNGKMVPEKDAKISVFDHGLLYGDGVFEGIRA